MSGVSKEIELLNQVINSKRKSLISEMNTIIETSRVHNLNQSNDDIRRTSDCKIKLEVLNSLVIEFNQLLNPPKESEDQVTEKEYKEDADNTGE
tara:strand:+ start:67 stop:348 length:282 start_codon:yes stop_codon:yes gene_type:complete